MGEIAETKRVFSEADPSFYARLDLERTGPPGPAWFCSSPKN